MFQHRADRIRRHLINDPYPSKIKLVIKIIVLGLFVHLIAIMATLEMNFTSTIDHGILPVEDFSPPMSNRVVLFVADGLRAEEIYNTPENRTPFLKYAASKGCSGVSLARVTTQSRSGYISMLAGMYEDPSSVLKRWKTSPMSFDHILRQTKNSWIWGSPDIISAFTRAEQTHIVPFMNESSIKEHTSILDTWVLHKFLDKFNAFLDDSENSRKIKEPKSLFFLHLLGIDTAGQGLPQSRENMEDLKIIDKGIARIVEKFDNIFNDDATTYIFTSNQGMSDWGLHRSGFDVDTRTPFIAWGAGIKKSKTNVTLNQIDLAPLISNLLGINIPVHSKGIVPYQCLDVSNENLKTVLIKNVRQLERIYEFKFNSGKLRMRRSDNKLKFLKKKIVHLLQYEVTDNQDLAGFVHESLDTMRLLLKGINHYHTYYRLIILVSVVVGFMVWLIHLLIMTVSWRDVSSYTTRSDNFKTTSIIIALLVFGSIDMSIFWFAGGYEYAHVIYMLFPALMFVNLLQESRRLATFVIIFINSFRGTLAHYMHYEYCTCITSIITISTMILGFKHHPAWFSVMLFMQVHWLQFSPDFTLYSRDERSEYVPEKLAGTFIIILLSLFPAISVQGYQWYNSCQYYLFAGGFLIWSTLNSQLSINIRKTFPLTKFIAVSYKVQLYFLILSFVFTLLIANGFISSSSSWRVLSWILSGVPMLCIPFVPCYQLMRLTSIILGFASYYTLMSRGSELMFMTTYICVLFLWLRVESARNDTNLMNNRVVERAHFQWLPALGMDASISNDNLRIASHYICFLMIGFFGPVNAANINFFDPMWTRCFGTVFSSSTMAALIIMKIIIPFILATCFLRGIMITSERNNYVAIFCYIIFMADCCFLIFMFSIKNVGSLFDIYTSILQFVIMGMFIVVILLLYGIAYWLTTVFIHESLITRT